MQDVKVLESNQSCLAYEAAHADDGQLSAQRAQRAAPQLQVARGLEGRWMPRYRDEPDPWGYIHGAAHR